MEQVSVCEKKDESRAKYVWDVVVVDYKFNVELVHGRHFAMSRCVHVFSRK